MGNINKPPPKKPFPAPSSADTSQDIANSTAKGASADKASSGTQSPPKSSDGLDLHGGESLSADKNQEPAKLVAPKSPRQTATETETKTTPPSMPPSLESSMLDPQSVAHAAAARVLKSYAQAPKQRQSQARGVLGAPLSALSALASALFAEKARRKAADGVLKYMGMLGKMLGLLKKSRRQSKRGDRANEALAQGLRPLREGFKDEEEEEDA